MKLGNTKHHDIYDFRKFAQRNEEKTLCVSIHGYHTIELTYILPNHKK